jgi:hypothetical protein
MWILCYLDKKMIEQVGNYLVKIEDNSIEVVPTKPRRLKPRQIATYAEAHTLQPQYVKDFCLRKLQHIGYVYLYHFDEPYPAGLRPQHYVGFARDVELRELRHLAGRGARLMQVVAEKGIGWSLVKVWIGDRYFERRIKREGHYHRHCWVCLEKERLSNELGLKTNNSRIQRGN